MQQTVFALLCFLAFIQAGYVVTRMYDPKFRNCEKLMPYGTFYETGKCFFNGPSQYNTFKCNSTSIQMSLYCDKECRQCQVANVPANQCIENYMKYTCEDKLPRLEEDGAMIRIFPNEKCDRDITNNGQFLVRSVCSSSGGSSLKIGLTDPNTFKIQEYNQLECKGNVIRETATRLDVCVYAPNSFQKMLTLKQPGPGPYKMISRK